MSPISKDAEPDPVAIAEKIVIEAPGKDIAILDKDGKPDEAATKTAISEARIVAWEAPADEKVLADERAVRESLYTGEATVEWEGKTEVGTRVTTIICNVADEALVRELLDPTMPLGGEGIALGTPVERNDGTLLWRDNRWTPAMGDWIVARLAKIPSAWAGVPEETEDTKPVEDVDVEPVVEEIVKP